MRPGEELSKIGPLIAENRDIARKLITHLRTKVAPGAKIAFYIVSKNI